MNLSQVIAHHADRHPDRVALSMGDEEITYPELYARVQRCAGALRDLGVGRSDIVGVLLYNSVDLLEVMLASAHIGAIFMPLNWRLAGPELAYIADHAGARALVSEPELRDLFDDLRKQGYLLDSQQLESAKTAKSLRHRQNRLTITDGPFSETKEVLGGFNLIEAENMEEAVRIASEFPWAQTGCVEVRPVRDFDAVRSRVGAAARASA